jgi:tetratricopeptide (TPR) repeat protein
LGDYEGAIAAYLQATTLEPAYEKAWFDLGGLLWNVGDGELALTVWKAALAKFPESDEAIRVHTFLDAQMENSGVPLTES